MAKAHFHKNQRVYVKPVGTWATIERVLPQWTKGLDEPIRVYYDVGLGREFTAEELQQDQTLHAAAAHLPSESWRVLRMRNRWQMPEDCPHHPEPGTYPVVVTGERDWGGWRVPGAEYDLAPERIEMQARLIASAPQLLALAQALAEAAARAPENLPAEILEIARDAQEAVRRAMGSAAS